jgi:hypothetical protein
MELDQDPSNADQDVSNFLSGTMAEAPPDGQPAPDTITQQDQPLPATPGTAIPPKSDPSRIEYWQSRADLFRRQAEELAPYAPLIQYLNQNPQAIQAVDQAIRTGGTSPQKDAASPTNVNFNPPARPPKPESFDAVAAYSDPTSESFKYARQLEQWRDDMTEYTVKKQEYQEQMQIRQTQLRAQEAAQQAQMQEGMNMLQAKYGFKPQEAIDFMNVMSRDENVTMDALVKLYKIIRAPGQPQTPNQTQASPRQFGPVSPALVPGSTEPQLDTADEFNQSMLKYKSARSK